MSSKKIPESWKECTSSKKVIRYAKKNGCEIVQAKGSHFKMKKGTDTMTAYNGEISTGVAIKIFQWFLKIGVGLVFFYAVFENIL